MAPINRPRLVLERSASGDLCLRRARRHFIGLSDRHDDRERIDIAIAIGTAPPATSLMRRHLADWTNVIVAAPAYLKARGTPRTAEDLAAHDFVALPVWHHGADVLKAPDGSRHRLSLKRRVTSNNQLTLKQLAMAGCGLCLNVEPEVVEELSDGRLVRVLPDWSLPLLGVDALLPPRTKQPAKVRAALDALTLYLSNAATRPKPSRARTRSGARLRGEATIRLGAPRSAGRS